jgi:hypothetical protein
MQNAKKLIFSRITNSCFSNFLSEREEEEPIYFVSFWKFISFSGETILLLLKRKGRSCLPLRKSGDNLIKSSFVIREGRNIWKIVKLKELIRSCWFYKFRFLKFISAFNREINTLKIINADYHSLYLNLSWS